MPKRASQTPFASEDAHSAKVCQQNPEAVALKERSPFGLKTGYFRALQRPLLSQPDALASGVEIPNALRRFNNGVEY
jgi:hypothetical protein